ncbi:MAG: hypothetical protein ACR2J8_15630, partial [Thermomicrobiales bacterium]
MSALLPYLFNVTTSFLVRPIANSDYMEAAALSRRAMPEEAVTASQLRRSDEAVKGRRYLLHRIVAATSDGTILGTASLR